MPSHTIGPSRKIGPIRKIGPSHKIGPSQRILLGWVLTGLLSLALASALGSRSEACPFCTAVSQTFTEEINSMDVVVVATLLPKEGPAKDSTEAEDDGTARFRVTQVIKGESHLGSNRELQTVYFGQARPGSTFLVMGVDPPKLAWSTPLPISEQGVGYVQKILKLPADGVARLEFFQDYLEHKDEMLARDAYDEFAKSPYQTVRLLKDKMDHDQLIRWIDDPNVPASRRRLYLVMLGICGTPSDIPMLEEMLSSADRKAKAGLDALIGCYLTLRGSEGMPLVEQLFLKNKDAEYADTYAAIMALRVLGTETDVIPRDRLLLGMHHLLERPDLADLVIPDLARWKDWSQMERLVKLFKESDEKSSWVRVPVINYLRACPKPEAKEHLAELEKLDPASFKRANTFFPFPAAAPDTSS